MTHGAPMLRRLSELLEEALDLPEPEQAAWLARLEQADPDMAPALRRMLERQAQGAAPGPLDRPPPWAPPVAAPGAQPFQPGAAVGPYRLVRLLGRGGMGEVWHAERVDGALRRAVALKMPVLGLRRDLLVQRFERERDILASLAHPRIARLYDAGMAEDGQPYIALELVEGVPITTYCAEHPLDVRGRVALLLQVTEAVQYAHARLIIHRDLKPSNVLVTASGQAMLLDFGIAKLLQAGADTASETELTRLGGRALTLGYAAPEQLAGEDISIATDLYALGVLLHEVLCGQRPFTGSPREVEAAILARDPPRPRGLAADLSTILQKALRRTPAERYATVDAFAEDLSRWARGEPVLAQPDSAWYRARRFVGRHRAGVATAAAVAALLVASSLISLRQARLAEQASQRAQKEAATARAVQGFLLDLFSANRSTQADPLQAQRATARELLDLGAARVDEALKDAPESRVEVLTTLGDMYVQLGLADRATDLAGRRVALARQLYGQRDARTAEAILALTESLEESGGQLRIPGLLAEAMAVLDAAGPGHDTTRAFALLQAADAARNASLTEARRTADEAVRFLGAHPGEPGDPVTALTMAGRARAIAGDTAAAEPLLRQAVAQATAMGEAAPAWRAVPLQWLGVVQEAQWQFGAAEESLRSSRAQAIATHGRGHFRELEPAVDLVRLLRTLGREEEAQALEVELGAALERPDPRMGQATRLKLLGRLAEPLLARGRPDQALAPLVAMAESMRVEVPDSAGRAGAQRSLAAALALLGRGAEAAAQQDAAEATWRRAAGAARGFGGEALLVLGRAQVELECGHPDAALRALEAVANLGGPGAIERDLLRSRALLWNRRPGEARAAADAAVAPLAALPVGQRPVSAYAGALLARGQALLAAGDVPAAAASLEEALALRRAHDAPGSLWLERTALALAEARAAGRDAAAAQALRQEARRWRAGREGAAGGATGGAGPGPRAK